MSSRSFYIALSCATLCLATPTPEVEATKKGGVYSLGTYFPAFRKDDLYYDVNMTFDGQTLPIYVDIGSSDTFIASDKCNVVNTQSGCYLVEPFEIKKSTNVRYNESFGTVVGEGWTEGWEAFLDVSANGQTMLDDFAVPVANYSAPNEFQQGTFSGIIGLGLRNTSRQNYYYNRLPLIDSMILGGKLKAPKFSLSLARLGDPESIAGHLTLGAIESLPTNPKITYNEVINTRNFNYHYPNGTYGVYAPQTWTSQLQKIRVNGHTFTPSPTLIDNQGRYVATMDSGSTQMLFRRPDFEAIGAAFLGNTIIHTDQSIYFECSVAQVMELQFNDQWYPIDPLDMIMPTNHGLVNGTQYCQAALGIWDREFGDTILGVPFLRNVLAVFDYVTPKMYSVQPKVGYGSITNLDHATKRYESLYRNRLS